MRLWTGLAGLSVVLAIFATGSAVYAWRQLKTNEAFLDATLRIATDIVNTAVAHADIYGVPRTATLELLTKAEGLFDSMARFGERTPELQYRNADMLLAFARNYAALGDTAKERARADEAYYLLSGLVAANLDNPTYQHELSVAYEEIGIQAAEGNLVTALTSYQTALALTERLAQADPANAAWQRGLSVSHNKVGRVQMDQGNLPAALASYQAALAIRERLLRSDSSNAGWQRDLSISYQNVGEVQEAQGNLNAALGAYQASLAIAESLAQTDPGNAGWQRDLSVSYGKIGEVQEALGNLPAALASYQVDIAIAMRLAQSDPSNAGWQRDLSVSYEKIGEVQEAQGSLPAALASYQSDLNIREREAQSDPGNASWQRDLAVSYLRSETCKWRRVAYPLRSPPIKRTAPLRSGWRSPIPAMPVGSATWRSRTKGSERFRRRSATCRQRSPRIKQIRHHGAPGAVRSQQCRLATRFAVAYNYVGDVQMELGALPAALATYQAGLPIAQRLAQSNPGSAELAT